MKRLIVVLAGIALIASAGAASARTSHTKGYHAARGHLVHRDVRMQSGPDVPPPNADLKYGPQPDYPQSPAGGGY